MIPSCRILIGDSAEKLRELPQNSVQCVVTSPPYWNLRDYSVDGQIGLEETFDEFLHRLISVFREVRRVLKEDGTLWVNMGDSYCGRLNRSGHQGAVTKLKSTNVLRPRGGQRLGPIGSKPKDLIGQPWRLAFALQADGWYLRQDIIWHKPNPMPESITDRCTKAHEYIFLLAKSERYFWDKNAIREPSSGTAHARGHGINPKATTGVGWGYAGEEKPRTKRVSGWEMIAGAHHTIEFNRGKKAGRNSRINVDRDPDHQTPAKVRSKQNRSFSAAVCSLVDERNKRSVWSIPTEPYSESHYATFPRALVRPCILAGSRLGDTVLDPFGGSGTTAAVAMEYGRNAVLIDINPENERLMRDRVAPFVGAGVLLL